MLEYKSEWNDNNLMVIDRFDPSTKMCSECGGLNHTLTLADRSYNVPPVAYCMTGILTHLTLLS